MAHESALFVAQALIGEEEAKGAVWPIWLGFAVAMVCIAASFITAMSSEDQSDRQQRYMMFSGAFALPFFGFVAALALYYF
ncbi:hypothetical protein [Rhodococcus erythropolis]